MTRFRPPHLAQGTWQAGALHVWGWNGIDAASMAWMYSGFRRIDASGLRTGWHDSPVSYGSITRVTVPCDGHTVRAAAVQLDAIGAAIWLSELPDDEAELSDSLAWFARLVDFARLLVDTAHMTPVVVDDGPFVTARWRAVLDAEHLPFMEQMTASMPPVCAAGSSATPETMLDQMVDGLARSTLGQAGWRPDVGRRRAPEVQALRAVFNALSGPDHVVRTGSIEFEAAVEQLRTDLDRHRRRLSGEPVLVGRLRLMVPDDPLDPWDIRVELYDDADATRWCTAADAWNRADTALELCGGAEHGARLDTALAEFIPRLAGVPGLHSLANEPQPTALTLELVEADEFLDQAPLILQRLGIELIGPEKLVRTSTRVTGEATPAPADDRAGAFGRDALVTWKVVVDETPVSDAAIARAVEAGTSLLHTGQRWVRIDAADLRAKRVRQQQLTEEKSSVGALELLQLANDADSTSDQATITVADIVNAVGTKVTDPSTVSADFDWVSELLTGLTDDQLTESRESAAFTGELRHYQRRALGWLRFLADVGLGGCLADDMGLGKTATTLAHLVDRPGPHLVVCPLSVVRNWRSEAARFTPDLVAQVHHGTDRQLNIGDDALFAPDPERLLVITTYGLLPRDLGELATVSWNNVVLDEAQMVKNPHTKAARAVRMLSAQQKLALTGTPVENRLSELWAIIDAVNPGLLGSLDSFRREFGTAIERRNDPIAAARLRRLTRPFLLRRTKADKRLLPDLPDKIEQVAYAKLTKEQATLYQQVVDQLLADAQQTSGMRRRGIVLAALMRLKQICNHPAQALRDGSRLAGRSGKLNRFDELLTDLLDAGEQALVFTQFREMGELLSAHIQANFPISAPFLHGGTSRTGRDTMIDAFQAGSASPLLIVSLKAGGTGLNLTAASQVIHYDRWWNPAVEDQATDRAWRLGQQRTVNVHKLVTEGTVEEKIGQVIDDKRRLADAVIGSGEGWVSELSDDELQALVMLEDDE